MAEFLVVATAMLPRQVRPGQFYMVTRRCTQRQFLLRPDRETNNAFTLLSGRALRATRPLHFFRPEGPIPEVVEMRLTVPAELGPEAELLAELRDRVRAVEAEHEAKRRRSGGQVVGRRAVLAQSWRGQPASREPRRNLRPRVAGRSTWARIEALLRNRAFVAEYMSARERWRQGEPTLFPPGTYWLRRFAYVPVAET
ncbi:MAG TPA: hypothetical protein VF469_38115 [Kofleriaceae bacterium]